ncbi:S24 family peptidase [Pseudoalteromonas sp. Of7M-16]|uniref:LexA family transcriptional regulator n=1 Tax=Pseudoalteromonas sp. Of7M-16 TaxID=2917756 RepID=UPI001EF48575|nr:S24 family peptidase [Pseudoalteromonas sp. Of7M-16]MCG7551328.1 helix-turn-helix domain-containing protein [Pseudoalteromonas sp. Of7M-16]
MSTELDLKNDILPRLKDLLAVTKNTEVAKALGTYPQTLNGWMDRNSVPYTQLYKLAKEKNVSLTWILDGEGEPKGKPDCSDAETAVVKAVDSQNVIKIGREFVPANQNSAYYVVQSDAMEPMISSGDTVLLNTDTVSAGDGIYVLRINDRISVCRLQFLPSYIKATTENNSYQQFEIGYDDRYELLGLVVGKIGKIK